MLVSAVWLVWWWLVVALAAAVVGARMDLDGVSPINSVFNLFFPVNAVIEFNVTADPTPYHVVGRYASFSTLLSRRLRTEFIVLDPEIDACAPIPDPDNQYANRTVVALRGKCTFVEKIRHILALSPLGVIIANNDPMGGLITMYSNTFNLDGSVRVPILFIAHEDYLEMKEAGITVANIATALVSNWFALLLSMVLLPPLLVILFYLAVVLGQRLRHRRINRRNMKAVKSLPVYVYNVSHMVNARHFRQYLAATKQKPYGSVVMPLLEVSLIDGEGQWSLVDLTHLPSRIEILVAYQHFFPSYKCLICLEKYAPLTTRVLVLPCKHFFHEKCLSNWLINFRRLCPLCNAVLKSSSAVRSYGSTDDSSLGSFITDDELAISGGVSSYDDPPLGVATPSMAILPGLRSPHDDVAVVEGSLAEAPTLLIPWAGSKSITKVEMAPVSSPVPPLVASKLELQVMVEAKPSLERPPLKPVRLEMITTSRPRITAPMQILSQFSSRRPSTKLLSVSIDSSLSPPTEGHWSQD